VTSPTNDAKPKPLQMIWPEHLARIPPDSLALDQSLPRGYQMRTFRDEDEGGYLAVMHAAGFADFDHEAVQRWLDRVLPDGFFLIEYKPTHQIVATAMATHNPTPLHPFGGELGWVAGSPEHAGKHLGQVVCAAATARLLRAGYRRIYLQTNDWRLPALLTYLRLGYAPLLYASDMAERWQAICTSLGWPYTPSSWPGRPPIEPEATTDPTELRQDADSANRYPRRRQWLPHRPHKGYALMGDVDAFGDESLYHPSRLGIASATPTQVQAGQTAPLVLTFTAGPAGLPEGAQVAFVMRGQQPLTQPIKRSASGKGQRESYTLQGPAGCLLEPAGKGLGFILRQGRLQDGQSVKLSTDPFSWTPLAGRREFKTVIDRRDGTPQQRLPEPIVLEIRPRALCRLEATLQCTHRPTERLRLHVTARDQHDNRVPHTGIVQVQSDQQRHTAYLVDGLARCDLSPPVGLPARAAAHLEIELPGPPGQTSSSSFECQSNPSIETAGLQLYVGDLHCHDYLSEAEGYPDEVYRWALEDRKLDFVSVVPQAHSWLDNETWAICKYMSERYLSEGTFVTLLGFEWQHSGYGDKVVHYLGGDQPYLPTDDQRYNTPAKLYRALRTGSPMHQPDDLYRPDGGYRPDALVISHHPGYPVGQWVPGTDFDRLETDVKRLVELWSMHGSSEGYDPADRPLVEVAADGGVLAALRSGIRIGFVAGSDTHSGRPGGSAKEPRPYWGGLAAVWAGDLTRRDLFSALYARHTYALTGARIVLKMTVNGTLMRSAISAADYADIQIDAWTPGKVQQVELLKNARLLRRYTPGQGLSGERDECHLQANDRTGGPAFYHCRITQTDGQLAVCSPVWVG
jgi:mycothiol synthase